MFSFLHYYPMSPNFLTSQKLPVAPWRPRDVKNTSWQECPWTQFFFKTTYLQWVKNSENDWKRLIKKINYEKWRERFRFWGNCNSKPQGENFKESNWEKKIGEAEKKVIFWPREFEFLVGLVRRWSNIVSWGLRVDRPRCQSWTERRPRHVESPARHPRPPSFDSSTNP